MRPILRRRRRAVRLNTYAMPPARHPLPYLPVNDYGWRQDYSMTALSNKHAAYPTGFIRGNIRDGWPPDHANTRKNAGRRQGSAGGVDHREKIAPIALELGHAHAADPGQLVLVGRQRAQHGQQGGIVKHHVRRHALLLGQLRAQRTQLVPHRLLVSLDAQAAAAAFVGRTLLAVAATTARAFRARVLAQLHALATAEHGTAGCGEAQGAIAFGIGFQQTGGEQLPEHRAPLLLVHLRADAEGAEPMMIETEHALGLLATQHVDHMTGAEALAGTVYRRQGLLRRHRRIPGLRRCDAVVAVAAGAGIGFAERAQQQLAAAV